MVKCDAVGRGERSCVKPTRVDGGPAFSLGSPEDRSSSKYWKEVWVKALEEPVA